MKKIKLVILLSLIATSSLFAQETKIDESYEDVTEISLNSASGDCIIKKGDGSSVRVELTYTFDTDVFEPILELKGGKLKLDEKFEKNTSVSGSCQWTLTIPDNMSINFDAGSGDLSTSNISLDLNTSQGSGSVKLDNVEGKIAVNIGSGDIMITGMKGEADVNTGSGDVTITEMKGEADVNTGSGSVKLEDSNGDFSVNVGSGDIDLENSEGDFSINVGSGDIDASSITLTNKSGFNSGSGDVSVQIGSKLAYDISVNSGSGDAELSFSGNPIEGNITMRANKRNGKISAPFKFDKEEEVMQAYANDLQILKTVKMGKSDIEIEVFTGSGKAEIKE